MAHLSIAEHARGDTSIICAQCNDIISMQNFPIFKLTVQICDPVKAVESEIEVISTSLCFGSARKDAMSALVGDGGQKLQRTEMFYHTINPPRK